MRIQVINGPNLNLLGTREPDVYGTTTLAELDDICVAYAADLGIELATFQSNHEGHIIDAIHDAASTGAVGIILNGGAFTHYSYAIHDALSAVPIPTVEVHISNIHNREPWRRTSVTGEAAEHIIMGRGTDGYLHAIDHLRAIVTAPPRIVAYGPDPDQVLDLRVPENPHGTVLLVHGRFWEINWDRDTMDRLAVALTENGWATANIEYRRGPDSFETSAADITSAIEWLRANPEEHGSSVPKIAVVGHAAGGYLAIRAAEADEQLIGTVTLAAITDLSSIEMDDEYADAFASHIGDHIVESEETLGHSALSGRPRSPIHLIHGSSDRVVSAEQSVVYAKHDTDGVSVSVLAECGYNDVIDPRHDAFSEIKTALDGFR